MNEHAKPGAISASWSDPNAAIDFLRKLRPSGPWVLSASYPSKDTKRVAGDLGPMPTRTFRSTDLARAWIAARSGRANIYYTLNGTDDVDKKPSKADIRDVQFLHVDIDSDERGALAGDTERKGALVRRLGVFNQPGPPSFIVDSGGGIQALWAISPGNTSADDMLDCEAANQKLIESFGGDSGTWNRDRLLRLPGTVNLPDEKKSKRGRVPAPAVLLSVNARKYDVWMFEAVARRASGTEADVEIGLAETVEDLDSLVARFDLPERIATIIEEGRLLGAKEGDDSRSVWLFDAVCGLVRAKVPNEMIVGILTDSRYAISESVLESPDPDAYAERQVRSAHRKVTEQSINVDDADSAADLT